MSSINELIIEPGRTFSACAANPTGSAMSAMATRSKNSRATCKPMAGLHDLVLIQAAGTRPVTSEAA